ncbi:hypothetical protein DVK85_11250 [Flavobacterium arcticum]|uniref:Uncharacterized protein n=1 Tax=Flavobacterium arcticum TaxID=1784713 RepID=A0A345HDW5_9FLAO|nr:hypothetical protein [Flavobacterium arcticum]AXG74775.1 hypothetical protein DVK85_11250 [Flavobacterium arcticum]KAF2509725.1 hypothetical protein E0W72_09425 [Flavobacterium arcticum]
MSTKIIITLFILLTTSILFAQEYEATIYFHDGVSLSGYAEIKEDKNVYRERLNNKILFRLTKNDEPDVWDGIMIDRIVFEDFGIDATYQYVEIISRNSVEKYLFEIITEGEVTLYYEYTNNWTFYTDMNNQPMGGYNDIDRTLWLKRKGEKELTTIGRNKVKIAEYFDQCPGIVKKLKTNEFGYNNLKDIVEYYNDICAGYDDY